MNGETLGKTLDEQLASNSLRCQFLMNERQYTGQLLVLAARNFS
jgi:hypothetical protein